jgi:hypothetical protein
MPLQFKTSLNSLRPSITELRSKQKCNYVTELRGQAALRFRASESDSGPFLIL